ncbi:MAG: 16S rRNA (guanine(527)-N(7))-methyltransferase RsmG [Solirubrobacterales bacterium]
MTADATVRRLEELALRYSLAVRQREQLARLLSIIGRDERAPTAVRSHERAVDVHIADSLVALELEVVRSATTIADLGAGAGFPGLALAVALPASELRLVESRRRKCTFMSDVLAEAGVENARVVCERAEEWGEGVGQHDIVTVRAVAAQPVVLEYAAPLMRLGGTLVDWRGQRAGRDEAAAARAADELGLRLVEVRRVEPFAAATDRHLHVYAKVREPPARFPRRAGMARKRPIGA